MYFRNFLVLNRVRVSNLQWLTSTQILVECSPGIQDCLGLPYIVRFGYPVGDWSLMHLNLTHGWWIVFLSFVLSFMFFPLIVFGLCNLFMN